MTVEEKLSLAERLTAEANDYRDIYNAVSGMMYYLQVQKHREILNLFWSRREDISFSTAKGRAAVEDFFIRETDGNKRKKLQIAGTYLGVEAQEENLGVGDLESRLAANPYIVVAGDRQTARGVWFAPAIKAELGEDGGLHGRYEQERIGVDFIREDGAWRIWHYNVYPDFTTPVPDDVFDDSRYEGRTFDDQGNPNEEHVNFKPDEGRPEGMPEPYGPRSIPFFKPPLPGPYETWTPDEDLPIM